VAGGVVDSAAQTDELAVEVRSADWNRVTFSPEGTVP
jgi:hypothetical protein